MASRPRGTSCERAPANARRGRHLLIVDDDDRIRELLKEYWRAPGSG